ncbi:hypothetical protein [Corynebacterium massiliense]|uniref:hypothetical protein n=1 Tax=Corynebacterium massiliense TaxID=441501 RepID=UPI002356CB54|nr:hypothetical protein [Corynebacterium massiliense]
MANSDEQSTPENPFRNDDSTNSNAGDSLGSGKHRDNSDFLSSETNFQSGLRICFPHGGLAPRFA